MESYLEVGSFFFIKKQGLEKVRVPVRLPYDGRCRLFRFFKGSPLK